MRRECWRVGGGRSTWATGFAANQRRRTPKASRPCRKVSWWVTVATASTPSFVCMQASTWSAVILSTVRVPKNGTRWRRR